MSSDRSLELAADGKDSERRDGLKGPGGRYCCPCGPVLKCIDIYIYMLLNQTIASHRSVLWNCKFMVLYLVVVGRDTTPFSVT